MCRRSFHVHRVVGAALAALFLCGVGIMVVHQPSKLETRVRFPHAAPKKFIEVPRMIEFQKGQVFANPGCQEQSSLIRSVTGTRKDATISWQRANRAAFESFVSYQTGREIEPDMVYHPHPFYGWDTPRSVHRRIMRHGLKLKKPATA